MQIIIKVNINKKSFFVEFLILDVYRRRPQQYFQRPRPVLNYHNGNNHRQVSKPTNGRVNNHQNSETTNTYRRPRPPPPSQSTASVQT
jgi:hypothetical protein